MNYFRSLYEFSARTLEGELINFDKYKVRNVETAKLKKKNKKGVTDYNPDPPTKTIIISIK